MDANHGIGARPPINNVLRATSSMAIPEGGFAAVSKSKVGTSAFGGIETHGVLSCTVIILVDSDKRIFMAHVRHNSNGHLDQLLSTALGLNAPTKYEKAYVAYNSDPSQDEPTRNANIRDIKDTLRIKEIASEVIDLPLAPLEPSKRHYEASVGIKLTGELYTPSRSPLIPLNQHILRKAAVGRFIDMNIYHQLAENPAEHEGEPVGY